MGYILLYLTILYVADAFIPFRPLKFSPIHKSCTSIRSSNNEDLIGNLLERQKIYDDLKAKLRGTCLYFVGMMGSGKSTVGEIFAKNVYSFKYDFVILTV